MIVVRHFYLKKLILASIYFDKLYIIVPTGDQYNGLERINPKAIIEFIKDIKDLPSPDKLPKDLKKLMIFDDVRAKEPVINEYFCKGRHNNCNLIYLNQNLFSLDRQSVRENCILFNLFEQRSIFTPDQRSYTRCKVKLNTSPLKSVSFPC